MSREIESEASTVSDRFIEAIADKRRVCCCICPTAHGRVHDVCQRFIPVGEALVLERIGDYYMARCLPCASALGYTARKGDIAWRL